MTAPRRVRPTCAAGFAMRRGRRWREIGLVHLGATALGVQPTVVSRPPIRVQLRARARLRVAITARQTGPGYSEGSSKVIRA